MVRKTVLISVYYDTIMVRKSVRNIKEIDTIKIYLFIIIFYSKYANKLNFIYYNSLTVKNLFM